MKYNILDLRDCADMDHEDAVAHLRKIGILGEASPEQLHRLATLATWRRTRAGEEIISHLSAERDVFFICEGAFRVRLEPMPGRGLEIRLLRPGQHFGDLALLADAPRTVSVSAAGDGLLAACPDDAFKQLLRENGIVALAVARVLARLTVSLTDRLFETAALEVRFRIQSELLRLAKDGEQTPAGIVINPAPTHQRIATAVGTHREAVTKEFGELTADNILKQKGRQLVILDIKRLRQLLQKHAGLTASLVVDW